MKTKKEELIERIATHTQLVHLGTDAEGCAYGELSPVTVARIYDKIRASILTPRVVALLKAIGSKPGSCDDCENKHMVQGIGHYACNFQHILCDDVPRYMTKDIVYAYEGCPLLTAEELKEVTG